MLLFVGTLGAQGIPRLLLLVPWSRKFPQAKNWGGCGITPFSAYCTTSKSSWLIYFAQFSNLLSWPAWNSHDRFDECPIHLYSVVFYQGNYPILTCCLFSHASLGFLRPCPFQELLPDVLPVFFTSDPLTFPPRGKGPRAGFLLRCWEDLRLIFTHESQQYTLSSSGAEVGNWIWKGAVHTYSSYYCSTKLNLTMRYR
jgi:hypothetical protein